MKTYFYAVAIIIASAGSVQAGPFQYECTIERLMFDDPSLDEARWLKTFQLSKLYIERKTGAIMHPAIFVNSADQVDKSMVVSMGGQNELYKAVSISIAGFMAAVTVQEFASGSKKPMALLENGKVMTGYCY